MKVINIDQFKPCQRVILRGEEYEVRGQTVEQFVKQDWEALEGESDRTKQVETMVSVLGQLSNIPRDVLMSLTFPEINALITVAQGADPGEQDEDEEETEGEEPGKK